MHELLRDRQWHDAALKALHIDRSEPGVADIVIIEVDWPDLGPGRVVFEGCIRVEAKLNGGVICGADWILEARQLPVASDVAELGLGRVDRLCCFQIETSSTGSLITIHCESIRAELDLSGAAAWQPTS